MQVVEETKQKKKQQLLATIEASTLMLIAFLIN